MGSWTKLCGATIAAFLLAACGYTEEEMAAKQRRIDALLAEVHALREARVSPTTSPSAPAPAKAKSLGRQARAE